VQATLSKAEQEAEALPTDDVAGVKRQVNAIGSEIGSLGDSFKDIGTMKNDALDSAFNEDSTCQQMQTIFS
jgi:hypothetical protein